MRSAKRILEKKGEQVIDPFPLAAGEDAPVPLRPPAYRATCKWDAAELIAAALTRNGISFQTFPLKTDEVYRAVFAFRPSDPEDRDILDWAFRKYGG